MIRKVLHFVQRGRILVRCGSAFALSLPSLGVSSLDLGRLPTQAALFLCVVSRALFFRLSFRLATPPRPQRAEDRIYSAAAWNGPRSSSGTAPSASASTAKSST